MRLEKSKILIIVHKQCEDHYAACIKSIKELKTPPGKKVEILTWTEDKNDIKTSQVYNAILGENNAKYKIYIPDTTSFVYEDALVNLIKIFESDYEIGMLGVCGAKSLPVNGIWQEADNKAGSIYHFNSAGKVAEEKYAVPSFEYEEVQCISNTLLATQYDFRWNDAADKNCYATVQSLEFGRQGYKVVIPKQAVTWCLSAESKQKDFPAVNDVLNEYAPYLQSENLMMQNASLLKGFGSNSKIGTDCRLDNPGKIFIGDNVTIGNYCRFHARYKIHIEHDTVLEDNLYLCDEQTEPADDVAVFGNGFDVKAGGKLVIGHHTHIEANVMVQGNVKIGCGCLIKAASVLYKDIPNHCVAAGNPAAVIQALDYEDGKWIHIKNDEELQALLEKRKNTQPILSIGIPTYNRSYFLHKCLRAIYKQIGNDDLVEVFVSDNASPDDTPAVAANYSKYNNITYHRNKTNIYSKNFELVWEKSHGKYAVAVGDDDYFCGHAIYHAVKCLYDNQESTILSMLPYNSDEYSSYQGNGMDDFVNRVSYVSTYLSGFVLNRKYFLALKDKFKFKNTSLNQVYIQLEMLKTHPLFTVLYGRFFNAESGEAGFGRKIPINKKANLANVFIRQYFNILNSFLEASETGLSLKSIENDKKNVMERFFLPWCNIVTSTDNAWKLDDDVLEVIEEYYADEPYYEEIKAVIGKYFDKQNQKYYK